MWQISDKTALLTLITVEENKVCRSSKRSTLNFVFLSYESDGSQFCCDGLGKASDDVGFKAVNGLVGQCAVLIPETQ